MAASIHRNIFPHFKRGIEKISRCAITGSWASTKKRPFTSASEEQKQRLFSEVNIEVKGSDEAVLASYSQFIHKAAECLDIHTNYKVALPTHKEKYTILKSPHIYKKHRAQYEIRTHRLLLQFQELTGDTADTFLEYIQRNCPEGVSMDVQQTELEELFLSMPPEAKEYVETQNDQKADV